MTGRTRLFRCRDTGEVKEFAEDGYRVEQTTNFSRQREFAAIRFFTATDGSGGRIDPQPDGSYQDNWHVTWDPA